MAYLAPAMLIGDEICTELRTTTRALTECVVMQSVSRPTIVNGIAQNPYTTSVITQYVTSYTTIVPQPWFVFSCGTWDGGVDYLNSYIRCRNHINTICQTVRRRPPRALWLIPVRNYSAAYNLLRVARSYRDPFIYLSSPAYGLDADRIHLTSAGYRTLASNIRYVSSYFSL